MLEVSSAWEKQFIIVSWKFLVYLNILIAPRSSIIDILIIEHFANLFIYRIHFFSSRVQRYTTWKIADTKHLS